MTATPFASWMVCGLAAGLFAHGLMRGRQRLSFFTTMIGGLLGACAGGFLYGIYTGQTGDVFSLAGRPWEAWLASIIGAALVLWGFTAARPRGWWQ